jgi:hypothetical protein
MMKRRAALLFIAIAVASCGMDAEMVINSPTSAPVYVTPSGSITLSGTATCPTSISTVAWSSNRGGSGTATDALNWTASGITLVQNRVNDITVTVSCTGGVPGASDLISVRANGIGRAVLLMPMNENKGTAVGDISGLGNDGTFVGGGNSWVAGKFGSALQINGSGWVQVPDADTLDLSVFTLSAWLYPTDLSRYKPLFSKGNPQRYVVYAFQEECSSSYGMFLGQDGRKVCGAALSLSTWAYLTLTYDGSTLRIYKDTVQVSTLAVQEFALEDPNPLLIGGNIFGSGFVGVIDEVRIYNEAIPVNNGTGDRCGDTAASITRDMNCAMVPASPRP